MEEDKHNTAVDKHHLHALISWLNNMYLHLLFGVFWLTARDRQCAGEGGGRRKGRLENSHIMQKVVPKICPIYLLH